MKQLALLSVALILVGCAASAPAGVQSTQSTGRLPISQPAAPAVAASFAEASQSQSEDETQAAAYCEQTGGLVERRIPVYGTNGPNPLQLAGVRHFCQYTAKDGSRIHILLFTLYTKMPTLAATAYIGAPPLNGGCAGNPASCYCTQLGGSDQFGGTTPNGGGWYLKNSIDQVLEACIFPDMSSIDSWGLAYHSAGIIRGINLTRVMRFKEHA